MKKICEKYFSHGTSDSIMRMTALATNWSASGRGSEVRTATFNLYNFDLINHVTGYLWTQRKTTKSKGLWFVPDHDCPFQDHYYVMGMYLMSGQGQENHLYNDSKNYQVYGDMNSLKESGASKKMSGFLSNLEKSSSSKLYKGDIMKELPEGYSQRINGTLCTRGCYQIRWRTREQRKEQYVRVPNSKRYKHFTRYVRTLLFDTFQQFF